MPPSEREALISYTQKKVESIVDRAVEDSGGVTGERMQALLEIYKRRVRAMVSTKVAIVARPTNITFFSGDREKKLSTGRAWGCAFFCH